MKIAISGAGVAGPAFAHWMVRAGHQVTIIEKAPTLRTGGYVIDFWGVGYRLAQMMGLETAIRSSGYRVRELRAVDEVGRTGARFCVDSIRRATGDLYTSLPRGDLAELIYRTVEDDVETIYSESITAISDRPDSVEIELEHGRRRSFDLLIGADGLHSNVRAIKFGPEERYEHFLGCQVAASVVDNYRPRDELIYLTHSMPGRSISRFSLRDDRTLVLFIFRSDVQAVPDTAAECKNVLRSKFHDGGWECPAILEAIDFVDDIYFDTVSQIRMDSWSSGRVVLIGDAAACVSLLAGEGTGLAIAEAYVLAGELSRSDGNFDAAFRAYEDRLRCFIEGKQAEAEKFVSFFAPKSSFGIHVRNIALNAFRIRPLAERVMRHALRDDIALPAYEF